MAYADANLGGNTILCRYVKTGFKDSGASGSNTNASTNPALSVTGSLTLSQNTHLGVPLNLNATGGGTITLPAAVGTGNTYQLFVITSLTSSSTWLIQCAGSDTMGGVVTISAGTASGTFPATAGTSVSITLSATTKGGLVGGLLTFTDIKSGVWSVQAQLQGSGTAVTPVT